jgi:hypothetical protein
MGRHKKVIENGLEIETDDIEVDGEKLAEVVNETFSLPAISESNGLRAYIKNGVTRVRKVSEEKDLIADGWKRK